MSNFQKNIVLLGLSGSGKDTISDHLEYNYNYFPIRLAGTIKQIIREKFNFTEEQLEENKRINPKIREEHHKVGEYLGKDNFNRLYQIMNGTVTEFKYKSEFQSIVVIDGRSIDKEIKYFIDNDEWVIIYLNRTTQEYKNSQHWTEQLSNEKLLDFIDKNKLYHKFIMIYNNQEKIELDNNQEEIVNKCLAYYNISGQATKEKLLSCIDNCFNNELI